MLWSRSSLVIRVTLWHLWCATYILEEKLEPLLRLLLLTEGPWARLNALWSTKRRDTAWSKVLKSKETGNCPALKNPAVLRELWNAGRGLQPDFASRISTLRSRRARPLGALFRAEARHVPDV